MKIEVRKNELEFEIESEEDLYVVYLLLDRGDFLYGWTVREFRTRKNERGERKRIYVGIRVEAVEYHAFRGNLRVRGVIVEAPEWFNGIKGSYHTIELIRGVKYRLVKSEGVDTVFLNRLLELFSKSAIRVLLISVGDEETAIALCRVFGIDVLTTINNRYLSGKLAETDRSRLFEKYAREIATHIKALVRPSDIDSIIIAGPQRVLDYTREILLEELKSFNKPIRTVLLSEGGLAGVYELQYLESDALKDVLRLEELKLVDKLFEHLARGKMDVALGLDEVKRALERGAVQTLLILDEYFKELGQEAKELIRQTLSIGASFAIIPEHTAAGQKLRGVGGIAALLRYELREEEY